MVNSEFDAQRVVAGMVGRTVQRCDLDFRFTINLADKADDWIIATLETAFTVIDGGGRSFEVNPQADPASMGMAFAAIRAAVCQAAEVAADGDLTVKFENGATITAPPSDEYEAWTVSNSRTGSIVCTPGGDVAAWAASNN